MKLTQGSFAKRALIAGLIAGGSILAASSFAMPSGVPDNKPGCEAKHGHKFHGSKLHAKDETRRAVHLATLKEKLKLKPEQEAAWNTFASTAKPGVKRTGMDRTAMKAEFTKLSTPERLDKMLAIADMRRARMAERATAVKAFYAQLTPEQQSVFDAEAMPKRHGGHHFHRHQS